MFIQCVNNETTVSQLPWKGNDVPIPKTGQLKENFKIQTRINCYPVFIVHVVQHEREDPVVECMRCYEWFHQKCEKYHVNCLQTKQPISFVKDAAKDLASYIASDLLEHSQVKWSVNFYHLLVKYITKLHPALFPIYTACFFSF